MEYLLFSPLYSFLMFLAIFLSSYMIKNRPDTDESVDDSELIKWYETKDTWENMDDDVSMDESVFTSLIERKLEFDTPDGKVVMCYHYNDNLFLYWTDRKDSISYNTLVNTACEYSVNVNVKSIFREDKDEPPENDTSKDVTKSVFMKPKTKPKPLYVKLNSFKYKGLLSEYTSVDDKPEQSNNIISWSNWKSKIL